MIHVTCETLKKLIKLRDNDIEVINYQTPTVSIEIKKFAVFLRQNRREMKSLKRLNQLYRSISKGKNLIQPLSEIVSRIAIDKLMPG